MILYLLYLPSTSICAVCAQTKRCGGAKTAAPIYDAGKIMRSE
ncbi:hypothetical protein HMPREF9436_02878 [Faecalibacterium cf. prausnitzii KLE1255]|uniref:Uncharacterized protein n=1 Tax=Faecalibacterium cf. prausnitzii KLE1255 TaxID=748224 RepID=E2ZMF9_9FIRM|nr:hypothetical protein HMPREF9436_02878 [Faecalibacterium cf. prausnitzii KLE1255]